MAGIREARQSFSVLLNDVKRGEEIVITEHGRPVARLAPYRPRAEAPLPDLSELRDTMPQLDPPLSHTVLEDRKDRI